MDTAEQPKTAGTKVPSKKGYNAKAAKAMTRLYQLATTHTPEIFASHMEDCCRFSTDNNIYMDYCTISSTEKI